MKKHIGKDGILAAMPVTIIATECDGKINFAPHGQCGTVTAEPSVIYTSVIKEHLTAQNIIKTKKFSVNIPSISALNKIKNCGSVSGNIANKSNQFEVFYGNSNIPMIKECPINFTCQVIQTTELNGFYVFLAQVIETYADAECLTNEIPNAEKVMPLLCSIDGNFWSIGNKL